MGSRFSIESDSDTLSTTKIISLNGTLREHLIPVTTAEVLDLEDSASACFLCNSDKLYFDQHIPAMKPDDELEAGQIYFVLHKSKLQSPLVASDMAALALKATLAMANSPKAKRGRKRIRISPVVDAEKNVGKKDDELKKLEMPDNTLSRSRSVRNSRMTTLRQGKLVTRHFRSTLSTIHEGRLID